MKKYTLPVPNLYTMAKKIILTVTNDLRYDQRMNRICTSLASAGYDVLLVGRKKRKSPPLAQQKFRQTRLTCFFEKGKLFYAEYNLRLFLFLLIRKTDCICAIDLDTILPCYAVSVLKKIPRVYDAHEYFSQMEEVISRPAIYKTWYWIERRMIPRFPMGYTVCTSIADEFNKLYGVHYPVVRNVPYLREPGTPVKNEKFILYQGAVNKGRGLEKLVEAMKEVPCKLVICGDGNAMVEIREAIRFHALTDKIILTGMLPPEELRKITASAYIALNPFQQLGLNQYFSLANKFFDYIQAGLPQVTMDYPEYRRINDQYAVAVLIEDIVPVLIARALNNLLRNTVLYQTLRQNCERARIELNWEKEQQVLLQFYSSII